MVALGRFETKKQYYLAKPSVVIYLPSFEQVNERLMSYTDDVKHITVRTL